MSIEGYNGGFEVKNTALHCVGTSGRTLSSFHPSYSGSHWSPRPANKAYCMSKGYAHTDTQTLAGQGHWAGILWQKTGDMIQFKSDVPPIMPERQNRLKGVYISKVHDSWTILEINANLISMASNWVGLRETGRDRQWDESIHRLLWVRHTIDVDQSMSSMT